MLEKLSKEASQLSKESLTLSIKFLDFESDLPHVSKAQLVDLENKLTGALAVIATLRANFKL